MLSTLGTCKLDPDVVGIVHECNDHYSILQNEERNFDVSWKPLAARKKRSVSNDHFDFLQSKALGKDDIMFSFGGTNEEEFFDHDQTQVKITSMDIEEAVETIKNLDRLQPKRDGTDPTDHLADTYHIANSMPPSSNHQLTIRSADSPGFETLEILKRRRRALKFKVKRKTIASPSTLSHSNEISIDSQYLLPDGLVRPNKEDWLYNDASKLRGFPYYGKFALYSGGGYVASLSTEIDYARATAVALEQDSWIDPLTRAVFFEFSVYNANLNFFATGFIIVEILPTGTIVPSQSIRVFKLYRYVGTFGKLVMASEIILVAVLIFFIYKECRHMYRIGRVYFKQFWSWVEITIAVALFTAIILRGFSWYEGDKILTLLSKDPNKYINFHYTVIADDSLLMAVTVICFASTLKLLKIISIFPTIVVLQDTLSRAARPLVNYALPFTILFCGFAVLGHLLFWPSEYFSTYVSSVETQMMMLIGGSVYNTLIEVNVTLGQLFFLMFAAFETFVFMNMFVAIIDESISESKDECESVEFVDYIDERVSSMLQTFSSTLQSITAKREARLGYGRKSTLGGSQLSDSRCSRNKSTFEFFKEDVPLRGRMSIALDNFDWVMLRLDAQVNHNAEQEDQDDEKILKMIRILQSKKLPTNVSEIKVSDTQVENQQEKDDKTVD